jgi:hypothetical protein
LNVPRDRFTLNFELDLVVATDIWGKHPTDVA